jgi:hypothetical protein
MFKEKLFLLQPKEGMPFNLTSEAEPKIFSGIAQMQCVVSDTAQSPTAVEWSAFHTPFAIYFSDLLHRVDVPGSFSFAVYT